MAEKNVLRDFLEHDPEKLRSKDDYFRKEAKKAAAVVDNLLIFRQLHGFSYRKFWVSSAYTSNGVQYLEWDHNWNHISALNAMEYDLEEFVRFDIHDWTENEKAEIRKWYNQLRI